MFRQSVAVDLYKFSDEMLVWLSVWSKAQIAYGPADATASHFIPFWYRLTQVVLEKKPLNGIVISV